MTSSVRVPKIGARALLRVTALMLFLLGTQPVSADPTLFIGNGLQSGGLIRTTVPYLTLPGPQGSNFASATNSPGGGFTIPPNAFSYSNPGYTFSIYPVYPYVLLERTQMNETGVIMPNYFSPGVATTKKFDSVSTMIFPFITLTPRDATVRLVPGPNGLGGPMTIRKRQYYIFQIQGAVFLYTAKASGPILITDPNDTLPFGAALPTPSSVYGTKKVAHLRSDPVRALTTRVVGEPSASASGFFFEGVGPWATGMLYANDRIGPDLTTTTQTAIDSRTAFDSGVISLVTPRISITYDADGTNTGTLIRHRDEFSTIQTLQLEFIPAPEPGLIPLIAGGVLSLVGLSRIRRR